MEGLRLARLGAWKGRGGILRIRPDRDGVGSLEVSDMAPDCVASYFRAEMLSQHRLARLARCSRGGAMASRSVHDCA